MSNLKERLANIRAAIVAETVSYGEIVELQDIADSNLTALNGDTLLMQWAGLPEMNPKTAASVARKAALHAGEAIYMGQPCRNGHDGTRYASTRSCVQCAKANRAKQTARLRHV